MERPAKTLVVEAERHDVAVIHDVFLALNPGLALGASLSDRARLDEIVEADDLSLDEALFEVRVDDAGRLRRLGVEEDRLRAGGDLRRRTLAVEARYHRVPADSDLSTGRRHAYTCRVGSIR